MNKLEKLRTAIDQLRQLQAELGAADADHWTAKEGERYMTESNAIITEAVGPNLAKHLIRWASKESISE